MSNSENANVGKEKSIHRQAYEFAGIRRIDTRALTRIISWSIGNCERQLMILKSALQVLSDEVKKNREKNEDLKKAKK